MIHAQLLCNFVFVLLILGVEGISSWFALPMTYNFGFIFNQSLFLLFFYCLFYGIAIILCILSLGVLWLSMFMTFWFCEYVFVSLGSMLLINHSFFPFESYTYIYFYLFDVPQFSDNTYSRHKCKQHQNLFVASAFKHILFIGKISNLISGNLFTLCCRYDVLVSI